MSYYNRFQPGTNWREVRFQPGRIVQSAELNEVQAILRYMVDQLGTSLFRNGSVLSGCDLIIADNRLSARILPGTVYVAGYIHTMPETTLQLTGVGEEVIGIKVVQSILTHESDETLLDPAAGYRGYGSPGADRLVVTATWTVNDNGAMPIYRLVDGVLPTTPSVPAFDAVLDLLARRTNDESGSYLVNGMSSRTADTGDPTAFTAVVESGKAYVLGWEITKAAPTKLTVPTAREFLPVIAEPKAYTTGTQRYTLNNSPVRAVEQLTATVQVTQNITRGSTPGTSDLLPNRPVVQIVQVTQGATTYVNGTDYQLSADSVDWSPAGTEPGSGTTYSVTYQYVKVMQRGQRVLTQVSEPVTHGSSGGTDALAHGTAEDFVRVVSVSDVNGPYVEGQDYTVVAPGAISWAPAGNEPLAGSGYTVTYWYWQHAVEGDFLSYDSYALNGLSSDAALIPNRNQVGFSPNGDNPVSGTTVSVNYSYYLPRRDILYVNRYGTIGRIVGQSAANPSDPFVPNDVLPLAVLEIPADGTWDQVVVRDLNLKRVTMQELQALLARTDRNEYNAAVTDLERDAGNREQTVQKKGIWTDPFLDLERADIGHPLFDAAVDPVERTLRPPFTLIEHAASISTGETTVQRHATIGLLPYAESVKLFQGAATGTMNVNPYAVFVPPPPPPPIEEEIPDEDDPGQPEHPTVATISINPDHDIWFMPPPTFPPGWRFRPRKLWGAASLWRGFDALGGRTMVGARTDMSRVTISPQLEEVWRRFFPPRETPPIWARPRVITITGAGWGANEDNIAGAFDNRPVALTPTGGTQAGTQPGTVRADAQGRFTATFVVPTGVLVGARVVRCQSSTKRAEAIYTVTGVPQRPNPHAPRRLPIDPLAQAFMVQQTGWYTKVDLYFASKSSTGEPIRVEVRTMTDSGFPSGEVLAQKVLSPEAITTSTTGAAATTVAFDDPLYLEAGNQYVLALLTTSNDYSVYVAELGQNDLMSGQPVSSQPYLDGVLFSSSNAVTWTAHQSSDLKFQLYGADFTASNADLVFADLDVTEMTGFTLQGVQEVFQGTRVDWFYSTDHGTTWVAFTPGEQANLRTVAASLKIKAVLSGTALLSPSVTLTDTLVLATLNALGGVYIGRNVTLPATYTRVRVYVQFHTPSGCTQEVQVSNDDGATWVTPSLVGSPMLVDEEFSEYTFEHVFGAPSTQFRARINQSTAQRPTMPRARNLMTTQN